ncbi:MAG: helix-turn-helix transcriptional regulator [Oceanospirillales bacterium]|nr:helix-turn-helix transcriptional regulator [Oceanospirillales bacterium]
MARTLNQILENEQPEVVARAEAKAEQMRLEFRLAEIRELLGKTQTEIADAMAIKQPTVAGLERDGRDLKLSTLKRYVEAAGGKVRVDIELPDGRHVGFAV